MYRQKFYFIYIDNGLNNTDILMKWGMKRQCKTSSKNFKHNSDAKPQIDKERENHSLEPQFQNHTPK